MWITGIAFLLICSVAQGQKTKGDVFKSANNRLISTDLSKTFFHLYTSSTGANSPVEIPKDVSSTNGQSKLTQGGFDAGRKTFVITHGFNMDEDFARKFTPDLLSYGDYNVISVNWPRLAESPTYLIAASNSRRVGVYAGEFLSDLITSTGLSHSNVHVIGYSLGAHTAGGIGRTVEDRTGSKVARVTALEPAKPWWDLQPSGDRVNKGDAELVDVWHTNSGRLSEGCLSMEEALGHVDFYPQGGEHQPGCNDVCGWFGCFEWDLVGMLRDSCSHQKVHKYFIESINGSTKFWSRQCSSYKSYKNGECDSNPRAEMGLALDTSVPAGKYYLKVNSDKPYARG